MTLVGAFLSLFRCVQNLTWSCSDGARIECESVIEAVVFGFQVKSFSQVSLTNEMALPLQMIEVGKTDDPEDSKFLSDDNDVEVTSEV